VAQDVSGLEDRIRQTLHDPRRELPAWPDPMRRVRRAARRQRGRLALVSTGLAGAAAVIVAVALPTSAGKPQRIVSAPACPALTAGLAPPAPGRDQGRIINRLVRPGALAVGPRGQLYIADDGLDQILQALPGGRFKVVAGNGTRGYSGDGGPAYRASLNDPGGVAVTGNGTIYFADTGNNRVRAVSASGRITTIAGNGRYGNWIGGGTPALKTGLGDPAAVAVSPGGCLYIADEGNSEILRLDAAGRLVHVAGVPGAGGVTGNGRPAARSTVDGPNGLAFDRAGNLYIAGFDTKALLMIAAGGRMRLPNGLTGFYPRGPGGLVTGPDGGVIAMNGQLVQRISGRGPRTILDFSRAHPAGISGFLPNGIAAAADGAIYLDTQAGNGYSTKTALIEIEPNGRQRVLWQS
jgi:hypothetical protein